MASLNKKQARRRLTEKFAPALLIAVVVLAFAVGVLWQKVSDLESGGSRVVNTAGTGNAAPTEPTSGKISDTQASKIAKASSSDHIRGSLDAEVVIIEYSDLECPFCSRFHPTAKQAVEEYGDKVAWVYRHFPLDTIHPRARPAAEASECVANVGGDDAFWSYIDEVFENQATALTDLTGAVSAIGVDANAVQNCIDSEEFASTVDEQYESGLNAGVTGTPGNFIMNSKGEVWSLPGAVPFSVLKSTIDEALAS